MHKLRRQIGVTTMLSDRHAVDRGAHYGGVVGTKDCAAVSSACSAESYFMPAEWHRQSAVQLTWPHSATDWKPYLSAITATFTALAAAIARRERVVIAAQGADAVRRHIETSLDKNITDNISVYECESNDTWARDHGMITLLPSSGDAISSEPLLLDFCFNGWGGKYAAEKDNNISAALYAAGAIRGRRVDCGDFVLEGGSIESDGAGTVFTTASCLLSAQRNGQFSRDDIEHRLRQLLHAQRIIWIEHGALEGDDTNGHIDTLVRVAPGDTLLYSGAGADDDPQSSGLRLMEQQLRSLRTISGKPYRLLRLPLPSPIYNDGERLPATYANFVVLNGAVVVPSYGQTDTDNEALNIVAEAFPDRDIEAIDARTAILWHGSLHCLTMNYY